MKLHRGSKSSGELVSAKPALFQALPLQQLLPLATHTSLEVRSCMP